MWNLSTGLKKGLLGADSPNGSLAELFAYGIIDVYDGLRPDDADSTERGTHLLRITLNGDAFVAGVDTNGLNMGEFDGVILKRAIDIITSAIEVWRGKGLADGTAGWARFRTNSAVTGASITEIRMDGMVAPSGAELNMVNGVGVVTDIYSEVSDVSFTMGSK